MQITIEIDDAEIKSSVMEHWYSYLSKHTKVASLEYIERRIPNILNELLNKTDFRKELEYAVDRAIERFTVKDLNEFKIYLKKKSLKKIVGGDE